MIEQTANPQASIASMKGMKGKGGKAVKAGLFSRFLAAFQKQAGKTSVLAGVKESQSGQAVQAGKGNFAVDVSGKKGLVENKTLTLIKSHLGQPVKGVGNGVTDLEKLISSKADQLMPQGDLKEALFASMNGESAGSSESALAGLGEVLVEQSAKIAPRKNISLSEQENVKEKSSKQSFTVFKGAEAFSGEAAEKPVDEVKVRIPQAEIGKNTLFESKSGISSYGREQTSELTSHIQKQAAFGLAGKTGKLSSELFVTGEKVVKDASHSVDTALKRGAEAAVATSKSIQNVSAQLFENETDAEQPVRLQPQRLQAQVVDGMKGNNPESVKAQSDQAEAPVNPVVQNKSRMTAQSQQVLINQAAAGVEKSAVQGSEFGSSTSQQNMGAGSQQSDSLLADASKADAKSARGADFSAHMNYKTAQVYKPAEAMLEIARSAKDGSMKLELQLEPAHLGKVQVTLQSDAGKQLQVHFTVDQTVSRQVLEQHMPQLRLALAQQGLDLGQFSMNMNSQGQPEGSGESGRPAFSEFTDANGHAGEGESTTRLGINTAGNGRISILA